MKKLNFYCKMYNGGEVLNLDKTIVKWNDLKLNKWFFVPTLVGYDTMKVTKLEPEKAILENKYNLSWAYWAKDDRKTWTSEATINKKALASIKLV